MVDSIAHPHFRQERLMEKPVELAWSGESSFGGMKGISRAEDGTALFKIGAKIEPMSGNPRNMLRKGLGSGQREEREGK